MDLSERRRPGQRRAQVLQPRRFTDHAVHVRRAIVLHEASTPSGQQNHRCGRRSRLDRRRHLAAIDVRHSQIGDHDVKWARPGWPLRETIRFLLLRRAPLATASSPRLSSRSARSPSCTSRRLRQRDRPLSRRAHRDHAGLAPGVIRTNSALWLTAARHTVEADSGQ